MTAFRAIALVVLVFAVSTPAMNFFSTNPLADQPADVVSDAEQEKDDPVVDALCLKALMHAGDGQHAKAIAVYSKAIERDPKYAFSYIGRGDVYLAMGDLDRALLDYESAARLDPRNDTARERADLVRAQRRKQ